MARTTITIDLEAYRILCRHRGAGQSFSSVIKKQLGGRRTARNFAAAVRRVRVSDRTLDALERIVAARHADRPRRRAV